MSFSKMGLKPIHFSEQPAYFVLVPQYAWDNYLEELRQAHGDDIAKSVQRDDADGCVGVFEGFRVFIDSGPIETFSGKA